MANDLREKAKVMDRGARFPSEMSLCRRYQVSRMTVSNALQRLVREGMLERRQGSGTYVTQSPLQAIHFVLSGPENSSFALLQSMLTVYEAVHNCAVNARCRFVTLSASATNSMMDTNVQSFKQLPKRSKIILFGYWFRHLFDIMLEREHKVVFIDTQHELSELYQDMLPKWFHIEIDRRLAMIDLIQTLHRKGCRNIAFLHNFSHCRNPFVQGYHLGLVEAGLPFVPELFCYYNDSGDSVPRLLDTMYLLRKQFPFDALIIGSTGNSTPINTVQHFFFTKGLQIPLVSLSPFEIMPGYASLFIPYAEAGFQAFKRMIAHEFKPGHLRLQCQIKGEDALENGMPCVE